jgi:hypothetical protein
MENEVIVQWLGDISLNGPFCDPQQAAALRDNLEAVAARLGPCDLRIANWESPLWGRGGINEHKSPRLATNLETAKSAEALKLDVVLLANNHVYDCLEAGFDNTLSLLQELGAATLGAGRSEQDASRPLVMMRRGVQLGLLNYVAYDTHPNIPAGAGVFLNWFEEERSLAEVAALARRTDAVLVHLHWGVEFLRIPAVEQRRIARRLVDAGARVVVGCHAHVLQGHEPWSSGYIFHGMGNFLFWPTASPLGFSAPWPRYVREVGVASCRLTRSGVRSAGIRHLVQEGLALRWDETAQRRRTERRLCRSLRMSDRSFALAGRIESFLARQVRFRIHAMRTAGGFLPWLVDGFRRRKHGIQLRAQ